MERSISKWFSYASQKDKDDKTTNNNNRDHAALYIHDLDAANDEDWDKVNNVNNTENSDDIVEDVPLLPAKTVTSWRHRWNVFKRKAPYYIPSALWLPKYDFKHNLFHDVIAGITVGIMLVPQAISYSSLANLPGVYGLYTSCIPIMIYTFFGHCRELQVGPEAISSMIVGSTISSIANSKEGGMTPAEMASYATILSFIAGACTLLLGLLRFGFLSEILSRPLVRGFILAVAMTIIVEQMDSLLGLNVGHGSNGWYKIPKIISHYKEIQWIAVVMGLCAIVFLLLMGYAKKKLPRHLDVDSSSSLGRRIANVSLKIFHGTPAILLIVVIGISVTKGLRLDKKGLAILGKSPGGLPLPSFPPLDELSIVSKLIPPAIIMSIIGFVETIAVAKHYAAEKNYQVSANRELVALGVANLCGSFMWAWPIFGSLTRSAVNERAGAKSQLSGFITSLAILLTLLFLMPVFEYLPKVVTNGILVVAGIGLLEWEDIHFLWHAHAWYDLSLLVITCLATFLFGVEIGLLLSIGASIFIVIKHTSVPRVKVLGRIPNTEKYKDVTQYEDAERIKGILLLRIEESLYFANMNMLKEMLWRLEQLGDIQAHPTDPSVNDNITSIVLDIGAVPKIDAPSIQILMEMVKQYKERDIIFCFAKLRDHHKEAFLRTGLLQLVGPNNFFTSIHEAIRHLLENTSLPDGRSTYA